MYNSSTHYFTVLLNWVKSVSRRVYELSKSLIKTNVDYTQSHQANAWSYTVWKKIDYLFV